MPLWSVEDWRVRIAFSYSALGVWHPVKLRGYGGRVRSKPYVSSYPTRQHLSSLVKLFWHAFLSAVFLFFLFLVVELKSNIFSRRNLGRLRKIRAVYPKTNKLIVFLLKCVMLTLSCLKFQLLLSGDVETNPGPGQLTLSDLHLVQSTVQPACGHWYEIGLALKIDRSHLDRIELENTHNPDDCFAAVLSVWLKTAPPPTWSVLLNALRHPLVDCGWLATLIEDEHVLEKASAEGYHPTLSKPFGEVLPLASEWYYLGVLLNIPESRLSAIRKNNHDRRDRLREILMQWLKQTDPAQLWHELAEAVEPLNPAKAQQIRQKYSVGEQRYNEGCQLTLIRAFRVSFRLASEWYYLGVFLEVSESSLSSISRNNFDYHDCIREMLEVWLKQTDHASWHDLAEAVELLDPPKAQMIRQRYMGEERHAEDLRLSLSSAFEELFNMASQWYYIGVLLNIPKSDLCVIRKKHFDRRYRFREMLKDWLKNKKPLPTWIELAEAVEPLEPAKAEEIRLRYCMGEDRQEEDHQLTLVKSLRVIFPLASKWYSLGVLLKIPESYLCHIEANNYDALECLYELLKEWLKQPDAHPTWHQLSEVVQQIHPVTAQSIRESYCVQQYERDKSDILDDALKQGYVLLHITKVVISGSAGNGKTHTKYVLFNEHDKLTQIRRSTPLFDDPVRALSRQIVGTDKTGCEWFKVTYHELNKMLAQSIEEGVESMEHLSENAQDYVTSWEQSMSKQLMQPGTKKLQETLQSQQTVIRQSNSSRSSNFSVSRPVKEEYEGDMDKFDLSSEVPVANSEWLKFNAADVSHGSSKLATDLAQTTSDSISTYDALHVNNQAFSDMSYSEPTLPQKELLTNTKYCTSASRKELLHFMQSKTKSKPLHLHWIHFIDSGGQPEFHELLQAFIRNTSVVMIVLKLSESLDSFPEIAYYDRQTGQLCGKTYISNVRNDQIIQRCIRTLSRDKRSRVLVVGTHLDCAHESLESIEDKNNKLSKMLGPALGNKLIMRSPHEVAFPLNALTPGADDLKVAANIRCEIAKDKHLSEPFKVPIAWFLLEQDLQKLERSVVSLQKCYELGNVLHMTKSTVDAALDYFHELNIVLYYPSILPNVIFVSPQAIVDKVTELIEYSFYLRSRPESELMKSAEKWEKLTDFGEISIQILGDPKFSKHYVPELFSPNDLLLVLQKLFIVAPLSKLTYFMPSLLSEIVTEELDEYRPKTPMLPPVLLHFSDGCVPSGVFCCLSVYLITACKWTSAEVIYRNCITFHHSGNDNCLVTIIDAFEHVEVYVQMNSTHDSSCSICQNILTSIESGLKEANTALQQQEICYCLALQCPCSRYIEKKRSLHAAVVNSNEWRWTCTKNKTNMGPMDKDLKIWFHKELTKSKSTQTETLLLVDVTPSKVESAEVSVSSNTQEGLADLELKQKIKQLEMKMQHINLVQDQPNPQEKIGFADNVIEVAQKNPLTRTHKNLTRKLKQNIDEFEIDEHQLSLVPNCLNPSKNGQSGLESQLCGVEVLAKTSLVVTKSAKYFHWKGFGFNLHIPEGSLPHDLDQCNIDIVVSFAGQYKFPDNYHLVSAVYWLRCDPNCRFTKPVSIEIQHCSPRKNFAKLCFVRSHCTQKQLPYQFRQTGGLFTEYCSYGSKELRSFSGYSIVQEGSSNKNYVGKVYYSEKTISSLRIHFALVWNTDVHLNVVDKYYKKEKNAKEGPDLQLCFESDVISLDIPVEGTTVCGGWKLEPLTKPRVTKEEADSFEITDTGHSRIPACQLQAFYDTDDERCPPRLRHVVKILGSSADQFFRISEEFSTVSTQQSDGDYFEAERKRKRAVQTSGLLAPEQKRKRILHSKSCESHEVSSSVMMCDKPTLKQLQVFTICGGKSVRVIDSVAAEWEDLGIALGLEAEIDCVKKNNIQNVKGACKEILRKWLNSEGEPEAPVTWSTFVQSLIDAGQVGVAQVIQEMLKSNV